MVSIFLAEGGQNKLSVAPILSTSALSLLQTSHAEGEECLSAFKGPLFGIQTSFDSLSRGSSFSR